MDPDSFESNHARLFEALRRDKGKCPDADVLVAYHQGDISLGEKRLLEEHLALCSICRELLDRLQPGQTQVDDQAWNQAERRLDSKPAPWRTGSSIDTAWRNRHYWMAAAAAAVLVVGAVVVWSVRDHSLTSSGPTSPTRGEIIQLREPVGTVAALGAFTWSAPPVAARFGLQIRRQGRIIWEATVEEPRYRPTPELLDLLAPQERFEWRVQGLDIDGRVVVESS